MKEIPGNLFEIGVVIKPQGLQGELKIQPWTETPAQWLDFSHILRRSGDGIESCPLLSVRENAGFVYVRIPGVSDRDEAEALRGEIFLIEREALPEPEEGSYYIADLIGCRVTDDEGHDLGVMRDVLSYPANDVYVVWTGKKEVLVPVLKSVLDSVDLREKVIRFKAGRLKEVADFED